MGSGGADVSVGSGGGADVSVGSGGAEVSVGSITGVLAVGVFTVTTVGVEFGVREAGYGVTPVRDRNYFHSIYYRELGEALNLPEWFEPIRSAIEQDLPPVKLKPIEKVTDPLG